METRLCRICGKLADNYVHIFKTEGLKNKIETCLPIIVSPHCLLPDTICAQCSENVDNFYSFIKNCLQNIIILEAQYDIQESCLKTKRKHEKGCYVDFSSDKTDKGIQTEEDFSDIFFFKDRSVSIAQKISEVEKILSNNDIDFSNFNALTDKSKNKLSLVSYDVDSDDHSDNDEKNENGGKVILNLNKRIHHGTNKFSFGANFNYSTLENDLELSANFASKQKYFDDEENDLISEIAMRKNIKRKNETILPHKTKIFKMDSSNKRKSRPPVRLEHRTAEVDQIPEYGIFSYNPRPEGMVCDDVDRKTGLNSYSYDKIEKYSNEVEMKADPVPEVQKELINLPQVCLLCDAKFHMANTFAAHVIETHGIDVTQFIPPIEPPIEKKKKIPNLLKIADLKFKPESPESASQATDHHVPGIEDPPLPVTQPSFACPVCPVILSSQPDLFNHLRLKHEKQASLICGLCLSISPTYVLLTAHLETCKQQHPIAGKYVCKICAYSDDNSKLVENHVLVHDFVLVFCKKQLKMFDPTDYIEVNSEGAVKTYTCTKCNQNDFTSFKEFSAHRRNEHQIFHCDLCNKSYGRNSHLWKHVNRLHKGHPSITCQLCYKTSASKYHLAQHFNKIHSVKPTKSQLNLPRLENIKSDEENFLNQKFQGFDFQSVKQSFMKQELLEQKEKNNIGNGHSQSQSECEDNNSNYDDNSSEKCDAPANSITGALSTHLAAQNVECKTDASDEPTAGCSESKDGEQTDLPKEIDSSSNLYTNIITNYTPPQNEGEYKCPKCFKGFHKKPLLKKHKKNCRPRLQKDLLTRCKSCSRIFKDRQSLTKHLINYHSEYACEICDQKVQSKCEIVSHIRFSHPNCHLFCFCGNILRNNKDLQDHKKDHRNSFVCQFCADILPTKIKLKMHILSLHRKILSLSCGICLRLFENQYILRDHVTLVHKNQLTPLTSCSVCGKNYGSKWKTYDHLNKSHGRIFKACKACLEVFDTAEELQFHFDTMHFNSSQNNKGSINNSSLNAPKKDAAYDEHKKDLSDSEYEENSEKNSTSDVSNDADAFGQYLSKKTGVNSSAVNNNHEISVQNKSGMQQYQIKVTNSNNAHSESEEVLQRNKSPQQDFMSTAVNDGKISLLEKRLLGKAIGNEENGDPSKATSTKTSEENCVKSESKSTKINKSKGKSNHNSHKKSKQDNKCRSSDAGDDNPLVNTSKRTVYVNSNDPSLCEICRRTWPAKKHLWQHYIRCHKTVAATVCGICLKTNSDYEALQVHLRKNHPTLLHGQGFGSNFICRICGRYHNASSKLRLHMAIHENFDWAILDKYNDLSGVEMRNDQEEDERELTNGHPEDNDYEEDQDNNQDDSQMQMNGGVEDINYESLIEQVECSSAGESEGEDNESDADENDAAYDNDIVKDEEDEEDCEEMGDNQENTSSSEESGGDSSLSEENSLESQMLKNMLKEKQVLLKNNANQDDQSVQSIDQIKKETVSYNTEVDIKGDYSSSEEDDETSNSSPSLSDPDANQVKSENYSSDDGEASQNSRLSMGSDNTNSNSYNIYTTKSEELDSAVRSISYDRVEIVENQMEDVYCEIQTQNLNQHEIQSAVDSIL